MRIYLSADMEGIAGITSRELQLVPEGREFAEARWALIVLAVAQLVNAGVGAVGFLLQMTGKQDWFLVNNLTTAAMNIGLNVWLIPRWGIVGAAAATGISLAVNNLMGLVQVWLFHRLQPWNRRYVRILVAGGGAAAVGVFLPEGLFPWPASLAAMAATYGALLLVQGLDPDDRMILRALAARFGLIRQP